MIARAFKLVPRLTRCARSVEFLDLELDGVRLLDALEQATASHHDVVTYLSEEWPRDAVRFLDALAGADGAVQRQHGLGAEAIPLYLCPIDDDLLCGLEFTIGRATRSVPHAGDPGTWCRVDSGVA